MSIHRVIGWYEDRNDLKDLQVRDFTSETDAFDCYITYLKIFDGNAEKRLATADEIKVEIHQLESLLQERVCVSGSFLENEIKRVLATYRDNL